MVACQQYARSHALGCSDLNLWLRPASVEVEVSAGCLPLAVLAGDGRVVVVEVEVMACALLGCSMPPALFVMLDAGVSAWASHPS